MRLIRIPLLLLALIGTGTAEVPRSFIHEFHDARKIEKTDPDAAIEGMIRCFRMAVSAGNSDYATAGGLNACHMIYRKGRVVETGSLAREVITAIDPLEATGPDADAIRRVQLFGFMERGYLAGGNLGEAMRSNRAAAETLRGRKVPADADAPPVTLAEVKAMRPELRSYGWRLIERESYLLDVAGKTQAGIELLHEAAAFIGEREIGGLDIVERFYAFKLLEARAAMMKFLGYEFEAIEAARELLAKEETQSDLQMVQMNTRLCMIRDLSQWHGPSADYLAQARGLAEQMVSRGSRNNFDRFLAKMEFALEESRKPAEDLRKNRLKYEALGDWFEASYADRDNLSIRAKLGEKGLDPEFHNLLNKLRKQGNKRGEPGLYQMYGTYLADQGRPGEAIALLEESLRLTRSFGWTLHEPSILADLFDARLESGDAEGAGSTLAALDAYLTKHPDIPVSRRVRAIAIRARALASLGDKAGSLAAFASARELAKDLPDYQKRSLTPDTGDSAPATPPPSGTPSGLPPLRVQPLEIVSIARPDQASRTRFSVFNPSDRGIRGRFIITGSGAAAGPDGSSIRFKAGGPAQTVSMDGTLAVGAGMVLHATMEATAGNGRSIASIAWANEGQEPGPASTWETSWSPAAAGSVVLDASRVEANPYRSVALFHELAVPAEGAEAIAFRLRSPVPLRMEYYAANSQELVAIDANGNGDFTEAGDLHLRNPEGTTAAILPVRPGDRAVTVEVRLFAADGQPLVPVSETLVMDAEIHRNGTWTKEAENTLK